MTLDELTSDIPRAPVLFRRFASQPFDAAFEGTQAASMKKTEKFQGSKLVTNYFLMRVSIPGFKSN